MGRVTADPGASYTVHDANVLRENQACIPVRHASKPLFPGEVRIEGNILIAEGVSLGRVDFASRPIRSQGLAFSVTEISESLDEIYKDLGEHNTLAATYVDGEPVSHAYVKTLLVNEDKGASSSRGFDTEGPGGWTPMYASFLGVMVLTHVYQTIQGTYHESLHQLLMTNAIGDLGAGLFLASAGALRNNRVLRTSRGLLGLTNLDGARG